MRATLEGDPSGDIENCVSALSGHFYVTENDLLVKGAEPIIVSRSYVSASKVFGQGGWEIFPYLDLREGNGKVFIKEKNGVAFEYALEGKDRYRVKWDQHAKGMANTASGELSGRSFLKNQFVIRYKEEEAYKLTRADGSELWYQKGKLRWEKKPNGNRLEYTYDGSLRLKEIFSTNPKGSIRYAWIRCSYVGERDLRIDTSDGRWIEYLYHKEFLHKVHASDRPAEHIDYKQTYKKAPNVVYRRLARGPPLEVQYYRPDKNRIDIHEVKVGREKDGRIDRVSALLSPEGIYRKFFYHIGTVNSKGFGKEGTTEVYDTFDNRTVYRFSKHLRLRSIERYQGYDDLLSKIYFYWDNEGKLHTKTYFDEKHQKRAELVFLYDEAGNVTQEIVRADLTGREHTDEYKVFHEYSGDTFHLLKKSTYPGGKVEVFSYLPGTNLLTEKRVYLGSELAWSAKYTYDADHRLIEERIEDGPSCKINRFQIVKTGRAAGLVERIEEGGIVSKLTYSSELQVIAKDVFDGDVFLYSLQFSYDERGRLIRETDPEGNWKSYSYNEKGYVSREFASTTGIETIYEYDVWGRPVLKKRLLPEKEERISRFVYDKEGNCMIEIDEKGQKTSKLYDARGLPTTIAEQEIKTLQYDYLGRKIYEENQLKDWSETANTFRGKPYWERAPDGGITKKKYDLLGNVVEILLLDRRREVFSYDGLGRLLSKRVYGKDHSLLLTETYRYEGSFLICKESGTGKRIEYAYDELGKVVSEVENGRAVRFSYDCQGRLKSTRMPNGTVHHTEYDLLGRVVSEKKCDEEGNVLSRKDFAYDAAGNVRKITSGLREDFYNYDSLGRMTQREEDFVTKWKYDRDKKVSEIDPLGNETISNFDIDGRLISQEKKGTIAFFIYDRIGRLKETRYEGDEKSLTIKLKYDEMGRVAQRLENDKKHRYRYDASGNLVWQQKPDGTVIDFSYDGLSRITKRSSSDQTIDESYEYDLDGNLIKFSGKETTTREVDAWGNVVRETLGNGLVVEQEYDRAGQRIQLHLPVGGSIAYKYRSGWLREVSRHGDKSYCYQYTHYLLGGMPSVEKMIGSLGEITHGYDRRNRRILSGHHYGEETIDAFDEVARVKRYNQTNSYEYNKWGELISERGVHAHDFAYDKFSNCIQKDEITFDIGAQSELKRAGSVVYEYDLNGNPILQHTPSGLVRYKYDALDRLTDVYDHIKRVSFSYDAWDRRLSKTVYKAQVGEWTCILHDLYLYDGLKEIGTVREGALRELRVLGSGQGAEIGAAVAIELDGRVYQPLHDLFGNIIELIDASTGESAAFSRLSAFGMGDPLLSPWAFQSKRRDPETGLIYFGRRYYDPHLGRFFTPDPIGYQELPNLYTYTNNDPLFFLDLYGLSPIARREAYNFFGVDSFRRDMGSVLWHTGTHLPFSYGKKVSIRAMASGMMGSNLDPFLYPSGIYVMGNTIHPTTDFIYSNGMNCELGEAMHQTSVISQKLGGYQVYLNYNATEGLFNDIGRVFTEKMGVSNVRGRNLESSIKQSIHSGRNVDLYSFSEGGFHIKQATERLSLKQRTSIDKIVTMGSPVTIPTGEGMNVFNMISSSDIIPKLDVLNYPRNGEIKFGQMLLHSNENIFQGHRFMSPTYQTALTRELQYSSMRGLSE